MNCSSATQLVDLIEILLLHLLAAVATINQHRLCTQHCTMWFFPNCMAMWFFPNFVAMWFFPNCMAMWFFPNSRAM